MNRGMKLLCLSLLLIGSTSLGMNPDPIEKLCYAIESKNLNRVNATLDEGVLINSKCNWGWTPLTFASLSGHEEICQVLIERKAKINAPDNFDITPLMFAANKGHEKICQLLLDHNAQIDAKNKSGQTPLSNAIMGGKLTTCKLLIKTIIARNIQSKKAIIALLAIKKLNRCAFLRQTDRYIILLIAQLAWNLAKTKNLFAEINSYPPFIKDELLEYANQQLKMNPNTQQGNSPE